MNHRLFLSCCLVGLTSLWTIAGSLTGQVTTGEGDSLPGVSVSATSSVLPQPRLTVTNARGNYRLAALPPSTYEITFVMDGMVTQKIKVMVPLGQDVTRDVIMRPDSQQESMTVAAEVPLISTVSNELVHTVDDEIVKTVPLGQDYRDLLRLAPGVQVTEMSVRGPSAGGNGQDNIYQFDGVDITLPLFGTLSGEPSNHDVDQFTITKGGAKATNFNRSGGLFVNSITKSGTNTYKGEVNLTLQDSGMVADQDGLGSSNTDRSWAAINYGGPLMKDRLFFYASYYAPKTELTDQSNVYGDHGDGEITRREIFGKLTYSPSSNVTIHASHRNSTEDNENTGVGDTTATTLRSDSSSDFMLSILEADWVVNNKHSVHFEFTDYTLETGGEPINPPGFTPSRELGSSIDIGNLADLGTVQLPSFGISDERDELYRPFIEQYGYNNNGVLTGGGVVGRRTQFDDNDFERSAWQLSWNIFHISEHLQHDIHIGYRHTEESESLRRSQAGLGTISFLSTADELIRAEFLAPEGSDPIISEYHSDNIEINDTITVENVTFNVGVLLSNDRLFGQGLTPDSSTPSGFRLSRGSKYRMHEMHWRSMIQPRLGFTKEIRDNTTVYANWSTYKPMVSSLPRAASWARNTQSLRVRNYYDSNGILVRTENRGSSSGKFFQEGLDPRTIQEYIIGYNSTYDNGWTVKTNLRHRYGNNFWEDTNNQARIWFYVTAPEEVQQEILDRGLYIPDLDTYRFGDPGQDNGIGGSSYVIAELDGAYTKYYEINTDVEKRGERYYVKGSYTWSHYYGNFDQDNASANNDANVFFGSSFVADGVGRQLWDFKEGNLKGDRRHLLKLYGNYNVFDNGTIGAFMVYQSGEAWEYSNVEFYREWTGSSSTTNRFSEPAGSRTGPSHYQLDLNYAHLFRFGGIDLTLNLDVFNVFDRQTDYNIISDENSPLLGTGRSKYAPRRFQLGARVAF